MVCKTRPSIFGTSRVAERSLGHFKDILALLDLSFTRSSAKSVSAAAAAEEQQAAGALIAGHSYSFHLAFTNPLYDPIQIRLAKAVAPAQMAEDAEAAERARRSTFQIQLPSAAFPVGAFAEAWEYDDEDDDYSDNDD